MTTQFRDTLAQLLKARFRASLSPVSSPPARRAWQLLASTDLLVAGPFRADLIDNTRPWVGSRNQEFIAMTERYARIPETLDDFRDRVEVTVDASGQVNINGWAEMTTLETLAS